MSFVASWKKRLIKWLYATMFMVKGEQGEKLGRICGGEIGRSR